MSDEVGLWVSSAKADFQSAVHEGAKTAGIQTAIHHGASISDLPLICSQIEDMVQSIALGLNELSEALLLMNSRIDRIDQWIRTHPTTREDQPVAHRTNGQ